MTGASADRNSLKAWILEALRQLGGSATIVQVCQRVWQMHEGDLQEAGDLFFTWQYDIRWAAQHLRNSGRLRPVNGDRHRRWELSEAGWSVELSAVDDWRGTRGKA